MWKLFRAAKLNTKNRPRTKQACRKLRFEAMEPRRVLATLIVNQADPSADLDPVDNLYAQVQPAIDAAQPGDRVLIHAGRYHPFVINKPNLIVQADSDSLVVIDGNLHAGSENAIEIRADGVQLSGLIAANASGTAGLGVYGRFAEIGNGVFVVDSSDIVIRDMVLRTNVNQGIALLRASDNVIKESKFQHDGIAMRESDRNTILNNNISYAKNIYQRSAGVGMFESNENTISNNQILYADLGVILGESSHNVIQRNFVRDSYWGVEIRGGNGPDFEGDGGHNVVRNNQFIRGTASGVSLRNTDANLISGNYSSYNRSAGYGVSRGADNRIVGNISINDGKSFTDPGGYRGYGFSFGRTENLYVAHNVADQSAAVGISLYETTGAVLIGNTARGSGSAGFLLDGSDGNTLRQNTATANGEEGFLLTQSIANEMWGNTARSNQSHGFHLYQGSSQNLLAKNLASNNSLTGFVVQTDSNANQLHNNRSVGNHEHGFLLYASAGNVLRSNTSHDNGLSGFRLAQTSGGRLESNRSLRNETGLEIVDGSAGLLISENIARDNTTWGFFVESDLTTLTFLDNFCAGNGLGGDNVNGVAC